MKLKETIRRIISGNGCDKCDEIDGDYYRTIFTNNQQLVWDSKKKLFKCPRHHTETFYQAYRISSRDNLLEKLHKIVNLI